MIYDVKETQTPHVHISFDKYCLAKNLHKTYEISDGLTKASTLHTEKQKQDGGEKLWHDFQAEVTYYFNVTEISIGLDLRKFLKISSTNSES